MTTRQSEAIVLMTQTPGTRRRLMVHRYGRPDAGKKAYLQASLHADETPAMLALHHLLMLLDALPAEAFQAEIVVVPYANPIGLSQFVSGSHLGRNELKGGSNFNRGWPDLFTGLPDQLAGKLGSDAATNVAIIRAALRARLAEESPLDELASLRLALARLAADADLVLDVHCDDEALLHLFLLPDHWPQAAPLAAELGCRAVLLAADSGGGPFDEFCSTLWPRLQAHFPEHPIPAACLAGTVELRGRPDVSDDLAAKDAGALLRSLQHLGYLAGPPRPAPEPLCSATLLEACDSVKAPAGGILSYCVALGADVRRGERIAWLIDPAAQDPAQGRREILAASDGLILSRRQRKFVAPGELVAKVAGEQALAHRQAGALLQD